MGAWVEKSARTHGVAASGRRHQKTSLRFLLGQEVRLRLQGQKAYSHPWIRQQGEQIEGDLGQGDPRPRSKRRRQSQVRQEPSFQGHRQTRQSHALSFKSLISRTFFSPIFSHLCFKR